MKYVPPIGGAADAPYVDGNPTAGIKGSPVAAAAIEHPMREIMAVITEAGLTPDEENLGQLLEAIGVLITEGGPGIASAAVAGLVKVGSGLSINGSGVLSATLDGVTAPTANALVKALATGKIDSGWLDFAGSLDTSGWRRDPDGFIFQWGTLPATTTSLQTKTFPIAFPSGCYGVIPAGVSASNLSNVLNIYNIGLTSFQFSSGTAWPAGTKFVAYGK